MMGNFADSLYAFEGLQFVVRLVLAELLFALPFAKRREHWQRNLTVGILILAVLSQLCFLCSKGSLMGVVVSSERFLLHLFCHILLAISSMLLLHVCFEVNRSDLLFLGISGFACQHIAFVMDSELIGTVLYPSLQSHPLLLLVHVGVTLAVYLPCCLLFSKPLKELGDGLFGNHPTVQWVYLLLWVMLIVTCFGGQYLFLGVQPQLRWIVVVLDVMGCLQILMVMYSSTRSCVMYQEQTVYQQMISARQQQYDMGRETVELINQKSHDLKHQVQALRQITQEEQEDYLEEIEAYIQQFDSMYQTGFEPLNILLTEKQLYCERREIQFTCIADGSALGFLSTIDLYTLLGNALENAIQCVEQYPPPQRIITLHIATHQQFLTIRLTNYFEGKLTLRNGLPRTTKADDRYHGYGMRGMQAVVEKYHGTMVFEQVDNSFQLNILFPI